MRILVISNFYPPYHLGGMGLSCQSTVEGLRRRGHDVFVLTSRHGNLKSESVEGVARRLYLEMTLKPLRNALEFFVLRGHKQRSNERTLRQAIHDVDPDVTYIWGMWNLPRSVAQAAEVLNEGRVLYRFADYWPLLRSQSHLYWLEPGRSWATRWIRRALSPLAFSILEREDSSELRFPHSYCVSEAVRNELQHGGLPVGNSRVIYTGFDLSPFLDVNSPVGIPPALLKRVLFVGRLVPEKGAHIAIEALAFLDGRGSGIELTVVGGGERDYVNQLRQESRQSGLENRIHMMGQVPTEAIPELMKRHGIVVVPSIWKDPLPRVAMEAMAAGRVLIGSDIGGLRELIDHGSSGLMFEPGDARALASALNHVAQEPSWALEMAGRAQELAKERFELDSTLDQIEEELILAATGRGQTAPA